MRKVRDSGLVPEPMFDTLAENSTIADFVQSSEFEFNEILDLAFEATSMDVAYLPALRKALSSGNPVKRYWARNRHTGSGRQSSLRGRQLHAST